MRHPYTIPAWKKAPFIRILIPLAAGIILQWYLHLTAIVILAGLASFCIAFFLFRMLTMALQYKLQALRGIVIHLLLTGTGTLMAWQADIRNHGNWYGNHYRDSSLLLVRISEPLIEKSRSFKTEGHAEIIINDDPLRCRGKLLLYFSRDSSIPDLHYGDRILIRKKLQPIKNSGNPGAFNYERYAALQGIYHNVFLQSKDWMPLPRTGQGKNRFRQFLFDSRDRILDLLRKNIHSGKDELGIAEALLIGYTNDLDKDLVQAYSNTGVVHIIAISGMHLGLIYVLLLWLFARIPLVSRVKLLQVILILGCLWLFSLITGASASVLRSAVMFSFITLGKHFFGRSSIYNSLAASAFILLWFNPCYLWDVGFQLSYLAVAGIIAFQRPIYHCLSVKNKWMDKLWQLVAVSLAAQLFTFPVCIYYFHQFPNLFLPANIIAVPLSGLILYTEIALLALSWIPIAGACLGKLAGWLVWFMNKLILWVDGLPFSVWDNIHADLFTTGSLYALVISFSIWLMNKNKNYFKSGLAFLFCFVVLHACNSWQLEGQNRVIVYHVPRHQAIDLVSGSEYRFIGDSTLLGDALLQNFHLKPARTAYQLNRRRDSLAAVFQDRIFYQFGSIRILVIDRSFVFEPTLQKTDIDLIIISHNPRVSIYRIAAVFNCKQYIFDASNAAWRIGGWKKECAALSIPAHSVPEDGAFVYDIGI